MKNFSEPTIEIELLEVNDVISTSGDWGMGPEPGPVGGSEGEF